MRRLFTIVVCAGCLVVPGPAGARVKELGANLGAAAVSCPDNCQAISRTTAFQIQAGTRKKVYRVPHTGKIVAWTVTLGKPSASQISFFSDPATATSPNLGLGAPSARLSVVRPGKPSKRLGLPHRLLAQSPVEDLSHFYGSSPSFALDKPIPVKPGNYVALTVPTWAPALALGLPNDNAWLSSRKKGARSCKDVVQRSATESIGGLRYYGCTYKTARLLYTVTYVPDPQPTDKSRKTK